MIEHGLGRRVLVVEELYGKNTRATTLSGSQIKLFIQVNDLETSEFVSEMLGETTQVYKTPVVRPGQGIFAPRGWAPHYTPRPLRSPLELREMSARVSILMVKNSCSFELTKIRHYKDQPYRKLFEVTKGDPPRLPMLREWQDEELGDAINPAPIELSEIQAVAAPAPDAKTSRPKRSRKPTQRSSGLKQGAADRASPPEPESPAASAPLLVATAPVRTPLPRKALTLGAAPTAPRGENCNIRDVLVASEDASGAEFAKMVGRAGGPNGSEKLETAIAVLSRLNDAFGNDEVPHE